MRLITRCAVLGVALAAAACKKAADAASDSTATPVVGAKTIVVTPQAFTETLGAIGNVVPRAGHQATLSAPVSARVAQIFVTTGQAVQAGQALIELDQAPFRAALQSAEAALNVAERANERQQRLANEDIVPRKDAEQAAADLAKARADAEAARRSAALSTLKSQIAGVVTRMSATLGAQADPGQPLVEVSDPNALDVLMNVTPTDAARVHTGAKVALSAGQSANGEALGIGSVVDISGTVDSTNRSVAVRVQAPTTRRPLRIGETIFGAIAVATHAAAIVVPLEALVPDADKFKVFVVDAKGIAHEREVTVGGKTDAVAEITDGLKAGERVVTYGAYGMQDSAKVAPLTPAAAKPDTEKP
ncbi:MAG TPA: efflux RND transporter periplasmic adaptor subunit [Gemmatimonadaceae bacterium]|jgi:membrane fusion protein (multidrug efflux system)